ncbi:MAG: hypothetical protein LBC19_01295 [Tannerella sp.]|jgi:hypothetical protein|nr:hypothetical protein [Tannerella sp.]
MSNIVSIAVIALARGAPLGAAAQENPDLTPSQDSKVIVQWGERHKVS